MVSPFLIQSWLIKNNVEKKLSIWELQINLAPLLSPHLLPLSETLLQNLSYALNSLSFTSSVSNFMYPTQTDGTCSFSNLIYCFSNLFYLLMKRESTKVWITQKQKKKKGNLTEKWRDFWMKGTKTHRSFLDIIFS